MSYALYISGAGTINTIVLGQTDGADTTIVLGQTDDLYIRVYDEPESNNVTGISYTTTL